MTSGVRRPSGFILLAFVLGLSGCSTPRIQAERTVTTPLDPRSQQDLENQGPFVSSVDRERLAKAEQSEAKIRHAIRTLGKPRDFASIDFGFAGRHDKAFQVFRNGSAYIYPTRGPEVELDMVQPRVHEVALGGRRNNHLLALSHNGTQMAWNVDNLAQQTVIRPQNSTFGRIKTFDVVPTRSSTHLVQAVEGNRIEKWSLISGNMTSRVVIHDDQPRALLHDTLKNNVIYGTQNGKVGVWHGGHTHVKYGHQGPVLEVAANPGQTILASASKDGSVIVYDNKENQVRKVIQFSSAVYRLQTACAGRYVLAFPTIGVPTLYDVLLNKQRSYRDYDAKDIQQAEFICHQEVLLFRTLNGKLARWDLKHGFFQGDVQPFTGRFVHSLAVNAKTNTMLLQTDLDRVEVWNLSPMTFRTTALRSAIELQQVKISPDGARALVQTAPGALIEFKVPTVASPAYRYGE